MSSRVNQANDDDGSIMIKHSFVSKFLFFFRWATILSYRGHFVCSHGNRGLPEQI